MTARKPTFMRDDTFAPEKQVFNFIHVPKCGGTTLHHFLEGMMDGNYMLCAPETGWEKRMPTLWGAGGHQLRDQNPIRLTNKEVVNLIVMREPLQRFISFYKHILDHPDHHLAVLPEVKGADALTFALYCESANIYEFSNLQAKFVAGPKGDAQDLAFLLETFHSKFDFYAPLNMLSELQSELADFFGKPMPKAPSRLFGLLPPKTVMRNKSKPFELPADQLEAVAEVVYRNNFYDLQLYQACVDRFMGHLLRTRDMPV